MSAMVGMDPAAVRQISGQLRSHASTLSAVAATVDNIVHQIAGQWQGPESDEFQRSWQQVHRPALLAAQAAVIGMATSADNNAAQQEHASEGVGGDLYSPGMTLPIRIFGDGIMAIEDHTHGDSWMIGPVIGVLPIAVRGGLPDVYNALGGARFASVFGVTTKVATGIDGGYRFVQDLQRGHDVTATEQGFDTSGTEMISVGEDAKNPALMLAGVDALIIREDVIAGSQINWGQLYHDPGVSGQIFQPGVLGTVWQSEVLGFTDLGKSILGALVP